MLPANVALVFSVPLGFNTLQLPQASYSYRATTVIPFSKDTTLPLMSFSYLYTQLFITQPVIPSLEYRKTILLAGVEEPLV